MLAHLEIRDILIIEHVALDFQAGLNILSGETGAGKSILLDALGLALGWRLRADLVRQGAEYGEVTAIFEPRSTPQIKTLLLEAGFDPDDPIIIRRRNTPDGRKTAWLNDRRVSSDFLRELGDVLLELHGQHDDRGLFNPKYHSAILDSYGGHSDALDAVQSTWKAVSKTRTDLAALERRAQESRSDEDFMRHALRELEALDPQIGEVETLDQQRRLLQSAQKIRQTLGQVHEALGSQGAEGKLLDGLKWLEGLAETGDPTLLGASTELGELLNALSEIQDALMRFEEQMDHDAYALETVEERLFALKALARKHHVDVDELAGLRREFADKLETLDDFDGHLRRAKEALGLAQRDFDSRAKGLSEKRKNAAEALEKAMQEELEPLKMERAQFLVQIGTAPASANGVDDVRFAAATNPGAPAGALEKVASGGELSRFLLALKVCLHQEGKAQTMIFDEIDRGVGGATADAVGRRLQALSTKTQILVVTHSPQVAALGAHHWRVEKAVVDGQTRTRTVALSPADRIEEIARMLSASEVTDAARAAAMNLLAMEEGNP